MAVFKPPFAVGTVMTHAEMRKTFSLGNTGGMRRSKRTGTLVLISDHTKGLYEDKWFGDVLHYTGMGKKGNQRIDRTQNRTLAESKTNGIVVHLFEVMKPTKYIYQGVVKLCGEPYQEEQKDEDGNMRKVWMFPVKPICHELTMDSSTFDFYTKYITQKAKKLSAEELEIKAKERSSRKVAYRLVTTKTYARDPYVAENAKERAHGVCQLCGKPAPFKDKDGKPYLESHHVKWLSEGGEDSINNTVALCPNCHRRMHVVNSKNDKLLLLSKILPK